MHSLRELFHHMEWADALVWKAVRPLPADSALLGKLQHAHTVQHVYASVWQGQAPDFKDVSASRDLPALEEWTRAFHRKAAGILDALSDDALRKEIHLPWSKEIEKRFGKTPAPSTLGETMMQVVMHSQYHRGQINTRIRELGGEPPLIDYISWIWFGRPAPQW